MQCFYIRNQNLSQHLFFGFVVTFAQEALLEWVWQFSRQLNGWFQPFTVLADVGQTLKGFLLSLHGGWGRREFKSSLSIYFVLRWRVEKLSVTDFWKNSLTGGKIGGKERSTWQKGEYLWCLLVLRKKKNCFFRKLKVTGSELILSIIRKSSEGSGSQFLCGNSFLSFCVHCFLLLNLRLING